MPVKQKIYLTKKQVKQLWNSIADGGEISKSCKLIGIEVGNFHAFKMQNPEFMQAIRQLRFPPGKIEKERAQQRAILRTKMPPLNTPTSISMPRRRVSFAETLTDIYAQNHVIYRQRQLELAYYAHRLNQIPIR